MTGPRIELHIEELVLNGFDPTLDHERVGAAVREELARLLAEPGALPHPLMAGRIALGDGGSFPLAPAASPEAIGAQIAQTVVKGMLL